LVRHHLLSPDPATRPDLSDPATIAAVARAVEDQPTLDLLYALTRADAAATGPAAWSDWKAGLIARLVDAVRARLTTGALPVLSTALVVPAAVAPPPADADGGETVTTGGPAVSVAVDGETVTVAAPDRPGLLAAVAGCLALHRLDVRAADAAVAGDRAVIRCVAHPSYGTCPDP